MQLKAVVLPDPLGPMSAVMRCGAAPNEQPSSALTPPNDLLISRTDSGLSVVWARPSRPAGAGPLLIAHRGAGRGRHPVRASEPGALVELVADGHDEAVGHEAGDQEQKDPE